MASGVPIKYSVVPGVSDPTRVCTARVARATRRMKPPCPPMLKTSTTYKYCSCGSKAKSATALNAALVPIPSWRASHPLPARVVTTKFFVITRTAQFPESATYTFWSAELSQQKSPEGEKNRAFVPAPSTQAGIPEVLPATTVGIAGNAPVPYRGAPRRRCLFCSEKIMKPAHGGSTIPARVPPPTLELLVSRTTVVCA